MRSTWLGTPGRRNAQEVGHGFVTHDKAPGRVLVMVCSTRFLSFLNLFISGLSLVGKVFFNLKKISHG